MVCSLETPVLSGFSLWASDAPTAGQARKVAETTGINNLDAVRQGIAKPECRRIQSRIQKRFHAKLKLCSIACILIPLDPLRLLASCQLSIETSQAKHLLAGRVPPRQPFPFHDSP